MLTKCWTKCIPLQNVFFSFLALFFIFHVDILCEYYSKNEVCMIYRKKFVSLSFLRCLYMCICEYSKYRVSILVYGSSYFQISRKWNIGLTHFLIKVYKTRAFLKHVQILILLEQCAIQIYTAIGMNHLKCWFLY